MTRRRVPLVSSALFVFYCTTIGVYLLFRPWTARAALPGLLGSGFVRGFISGLGLIHLAAGFADLRVLSRALQGGGPPPVPGAR